MTNEPDRTEVVCPNRCWRPAGFGLQLVTPREFRYHDGEIGTRNYCSECGAELVEAGEEIDD